MRRQQSFARLTQMQDGSIGYESSYDPALVAALKASIPWQERRWDGVEKMWRVAPQHAQALKDISRQHLGVDAEVQGNLFAASGPQVVTRLVKLEYLGAAKDRGGDEPTASGWADGGWNLIFPLSTLRKWFDLDDARPDEATTLYSVLSVKRDANGATIKKAYRRAARTWHPDVNKEPDAASQFRRVQEAYEVLSDPLKRKKYHAGLALAASVGKAQGPMQQAGPVWRPPLRCGLVMIEGESILGKLKVNKILQWEDITHNGRVMVSYWPRGGDRFDVRWV